MRVAGIMLISIALTSAVIGNAYYQKKQFYPSVVYITKSNPSMAVIYVQGLILVFMMNTVLRKIFFGNLRAAELEHLVEKVWYAVTETCLAFTVFRDDFSPKFVALFTLLLFLKSFHWLAEDRVDFMERSPVITWLFHLRVGTLLGLLYIINLTMFQYAYNSTLAKGASVQLVFGFEYALLLTVVLNITIKYILHTIDLQSENPWDNKPVFLLYTELIIGLMKVILYIGFVTVMVRIYTLPLFAFRPMYYTMRNFKKAFHDIVMSRRAIRNMNTLYPDATPEELAAADNVCIICREEMVSASKKLPCNHIFHTACLRSWFQRQQTCPTCRLNILRPTTTRRETRPPNQPQGAAPAPQPVPAAPGVEQYPPGFLQHIANMQVPGGGIAAPAQGQNNNANVPFPLLQPLGVGGVPFFAPPFPPMIPLPPVPTPPPNLTTLSEEELRAMEGNLRQALEARIQMLQRVQLLLDAANAMMNQYQTVAATLATNIPSTSNEVPQTSKSDTSSTEPTSSKNVGNHNSKTVVDFPKASTSAESSTSHKSTNSSDVSPSTSTINSETSEEQDTIRRRRLQKFLAQSPAE